MEKQSSSNLDKANINVIDLPKRRMRSQSKLTSKGSPNSLKSQKLETLKMKIFKKNAKSKHFTHKKKTFS